MEAGTGGHEPVFLREALEFLDVKKGGNYIDGTLGAGGHGIEILKKGGRLLGLDLDKDALSFARRRIKDKGFREEEDFSLVQTNFKNIAEIAGELGFIPANGVLFDLGISSMELEESGRGFSFMKDEPLDMRMDPSSQGVTAGDLLNSLRVDQLEELFSKTCEKSKARRVTQALIAARNSGQIKSSGELANLVRSVYKGRKSHIDAATTVFLALRMTVNSELENLEAAIRRAFEILASNGRLVVISFHSGEDRIVKNFGRIMEKKNEGEILTKKPIIPSSPEVFDNPRSRSAKLRAFKKI